MTELLDGWRAVPDWTAMRGRVRFVRAQAIRRELVGVPLQAVAICADLDHNVFNAAHTDPQVGAALRETHWFELAEWTSSGPGSADSLWQFDGWHQGDYGGIYFYNDWRAETPWGHTRPDYGRGETATAPRPPFAVGHTVA